MLIKGRRWEHQDQEVFKATETASIQGQKQASIQGHVDDGWKDQEGKKRQLYERFFEDSTSKSGWTICYY